MKGLEGRVQVKIMAGIGKLCQDEGKGKEPASASRSSKRQTPRLARYGEKYFLENILRSILFFLKFDPSSIEEKFGDRSRRKLAKGNE